MQIVLIFVIIILTLTGCSSSRNYIENPGFKIEGKQIDNKLAFKQLFLEGNTPYKINFCSADEDTGSCLPDKQALLAKGFGGLFLPLVLSLQALEVKTVKYKNDDIYFKTKLLAAVNKVPPICTNVGAKLKIISAEQVNLKLNNFYCNWLVIGNVVNNIKFSIDNIDLNERSFTGYYSLSFYGTGNANGSGYYRAVIEESLTK